MEDRTLKRLTQLSLMLDAATDEVAVLDEEQVRAVQEYEVAYARAFVKQEGSVDLRKQNAVLICADLKLAAELAKAKFRACQERIRTLKAQIEVGRSLNAAHRMEFMAGNQVT